MSPCPSTVDSLLGWSWRGIPPCFGRMKTVISKNECSSENTGMHSECFKPFAPQSRPSRNGPRRRICHASQGSSRERFDRHRREMLTLCLLLLFRGEEHEVAKECRVHVLRMSPSAERNKLDSMVKLTDVRRCSPENPAPPSRGLGVLACP